MLGKRKVRGREGKKQSKKKRTKKGEQQVVLSSASSLLKSATYGRNIRSPAAGALYLNFTHNGFTFDSTGVVTQLNVVAQGPGNNQRVGKVISLKSYQIKGYIWNDTTARVADFCMCLVYDKRPTGAMPILSDIFQQSGGIPIITGNALIKMDASNRFLILRRWNLSCIGSINTFPTQTYNDASAVIVDDYVDLKGLPTVYKSLATGAIGDVEEGALYLVTWSGLAPLSGGVSDFEMRLRYVDHP